MKNLVDSSGWIEYFVNGKNAAFFTPVIRNVQNLIVPTICIYEVFKRVHIDLGEDIALQTVGIMSLGDLVDLNRSIALSAAKISLDHKLAMADSLILATAREHNATLWTQDQHYFNGISDVRYIAK